MDHRPSGQGHDDSGLVRRTRADPPDAFWSLVCLVHRSSPQRPLQAGQRLGEHGELNILRNTEGGVIIAVAAPLGFIPIMTATPKSDGQSDAADDRKKASVLVVPCYSMDGQHLEKVMCRGIASFIHHGGKQPSNNHPRTVSRRETTLGNRVCLALCRAVL